MAALFALLSLERQLAPGYLDLVLQRVRSCLEPWTTEAQVYHSLLPEGLLVSTAPIVRGRLVLDGQELQKDPLGESNLSSSAAICATIRSLENEFAFVRFCRRARKVVAARDRFGVRPLYWRLLPGAVALSSSLRALARLPDVGLTINKKSVVEFLALGMQPRVEPTIYQEIQRFPPAHMLEIDQAGLRFSRYWRLPVEPPLWDLKPGEYLEEFAGRVSSAVLKRTAPAHTGLLLSGGIDSALLGAAMTGRLEKKTAGRVTAFTFCAQGDPEAGLAALTARTLGLPHLICHEGYQLGVLPARPVPTPQPDPDPFPLASHSASLAIENHQISVALIGEDGDALLRPASIIEVLMASGVLRTTAELLKSALILPRRPTCGLRRQLRRWGLLSPPSPKLPRWLRPEVLAVAELGSTFSRKDAVDHPWRPRSYAALTNTATHCAFFESLTPEWTGTATEYRLPLMHPPLVEWALRLPSWPYCLDKWTERQLLRPILPSQVVERAKTGAFLPGDLFRLDPDLFRDLHPSVEEWVDLAGISAAAHNPTGKEDAAALYRVVALSRWMRQFEDAR